MGPSLIGTDHAGIVDGVPRAAASFNGAVPDRDGSRRDRGGRIPVVDQASMGPSLIGTDHATLAGGGFLGAAASMGPSLIGTDHLSSHLDSTRASTLQWGRP